MTNFAIVETVVHPCCAVAREHLAGIGEIEPAMGEGGGSFGGIVGDRHLINVNTFILAVNIAALDKVSCLRSIHLCTSGSSLLGLTRRSIISLKDGCPGVSPGMIGAQRAMSARRLSCL